MSSVDNYATKQRSQNLEQVWQLLIDHIGDKSKSKWLECHREEFEERFLDSRAPTESGPTRVADLLEIVYKDNEPAPIHVNNATQRHKDTGAQDLLKVYYTKVR